MVPGADGVRPSFARRTFHPGRPALTKYAGRTLNLKVKYRESFRPFAPSVLREDFADWFELDSDSPYMLIVADVREDKRRLMTVEEQDFSVSIRSMCHARKFRPSPMSTIPHGFRPYTPTPIRYSTGC